MKKYSSNKDVRRFVHSLTKMGWRFVSGGKHDHLCLPDQRIKIAIPGSPSDHRAILNLKAQVRQAGRTKNSLD